MSIWHPSMFAFNGPANCAAPECYPGQAPVSPLGPGWEQDKWWFRGPDYRSELPSGDDAAVLPAGGSWTTEITCHKDYTTYGTLTTTPGEDEECCLYHSHLEGSEAQVKEGAAGCALGIADVTSPDDATMDNIVIFSIQATCVWTRETTFDIPSAMPACSGEWCICAWFWPSTYRTSSKLFGYISLNSLRMPTFQLYSMTGFYCKVDGAASTVRWGSPLQDAVYCADDSSKCVEGPRRAMYAFNTPNNTPEWDSTNPNAKRPAYGSTWGWTAGAQNDIFTGEVASSARSTNPSAEEGASVSSTSSGSAKTSDGAEGSTTLSSSEATGTSPSSSSATPSSSASAGSSTSSSSPSISTASMIAIPIMLLFAGWMFYRKWKAYQLSKKTAALVQRDEEIALKKTKRRRRKRKGERSEESSSEEER
ncbi:hypothetical protein BCR35DRAFT_334678 [Leucosporidium creatinivorum]|uniref:Uncharacterized protein n=1 Tax=Leucosporidium creatinivorum TaxID=106004 RepID=A0A1Y2DZW9_9BASI|nr:hypothetical protein BCR35DRAFT_334678 [Leucosporidium creatinivorum]